MKKKDIKSGIIIMSAVAMLSGCASQYGIVGVERTRMLVDSRYDGRVSEEAEAFLAPYKQKVDSVTRPVVGRAACYMAPYSPESALSNLLPDILMWAAKDYGEKPDFAVYNIGGMRAAIAEGDVTVGDIFDVAPFDNKICFVTLSGEKVLELFRQIAGNGGEGVSREIRLRMKKDGELTGLTIGGKEVEPTRDYRVATIDFVAQGNDNMTAFGSSRMVNSPQENSNNVRVLIENYFREAADNGVAVEGKIEAALLWRINITRLKNICDDEKNLFVDICMCVHCCGSGTEEAVGDIAY